MRWLWVCALSLVGAASLAAGVPGDQLLPHGEGVDTLLPRHQQDVSSADIRLLTPIVFYGEVYDTIFVNANGLLSFLTDIPLFFSIQFPLDYPVIAPLYSHVDTRASGTVSYRETQDPEILSALKTLIRQYFSSAEDFEPKSAFIATWDSVGYYDMGADKVNTYQVVVTSDGQRSFAQFLYADDGIQWVQGSGQEGGLPDARAQAGLVAADGRLYTLRGSGTDHVQNLYRWSNIGEPGIWLFNIGETDERGNILLPDLAEDPSGADAEVNSCAQQGITTCHSHATCLDYETGFCCTCNEGYYGNGIHCLKEGGHMRMNGKVTGVVNDIELEVLDMQSYIVTPDGRTYTAVSRVPELLGYDMQTLSILGGVIGWVFARPVGKGLNGYQLTGGVFNHTAEIEFPNTGHKITLRQRFLGLDVFDQLRVEADIRGSAPTVPIGSKIRVPEYEIEYRRTAPGKILAKSSHSFQLEDAPVDNPFIVQQSIDYDECTSSGPEVSTFHLKVIRNFISYEEKEKIIRYGMTSKVTIPDAVVDLCQEIKCGPHSSCITVDDISQCVCDAGYQRLYLSDGGSTSREECVDVNECTSGTHNCALNAQCVNNPGSFSCRCNPGFTGDGRTCDKLLSCSDLRCHPDAECVELHPGSLQCQCLPGFTGNGVFCTAIEKLSCTVANNCSPFGVCAYDELTAGYHCQCLPGYVGDGYSCVDSTLLPQQPPSTLAPSGPLPGQSEEETAPAPTCTLGVCLCPPSYELRNGACLPKTEQFSGDDVAYPMLTCFDGSCVCPLGYEASDEGHCKPAEGAAAGRMGTKGPSGWKLPCNIINTCHPYAQCVFNSALGQYRCQCNAGFEGDGYDCIETDVSCAEVNICDIHASCVYEENIGKHVCKCDPGFQGDGTYCTSADECIADEDCGNNAQCLWSEQENRNECQCSTGYVRIGSSCQPKPGGDECEEACHYNARCVFDGDLGEYRCRCSAGFVGDGTDCQPEPLGCNILNNCGVGADCSYDQASAGYRCKCRQGMRGDGYTCVPEITCITNPELCSRDATCVADATGSYICQCNPGFRGNGAFCRRISKHEGNFLLLNRGMAMMRVPFKPSRKDPGNFIFYQYYQMAIGIDIDCEEGRVYWSDITGKRIKSSNYNGSNSTIFISTDIQSPEGISIDWVSRNMFWTDSTKDTVEVANLDTGLRKVLVSKGLVNPRGIAAHPSRGKIFWSDWNRASPKLEWANMDGSDRQTFLEGPSVQLPNSLAIDFERDELCWADAGTKSIACIGISTSQQRTIVANASYPFGLTISPDNYYWTDWNTNKIESAQRPYGQRNPSLEVPLGGSGKLYDIVAVPEECIRASSSCATGAECGERRLCLPDGRGGRSCPCADYGTTATGEEGSGEAAECNDIL
ncbi:nidogen isoform X1 [Schistocerca americana]|uniref:nidogen isoform X1 n=1 Tax=Schistocerca americana TaxID=7009 RepID=UPI001F4F9A0C|nr:nidogen isoform X1 [Schistocerca americana]